VLQDLLGQLPSGLIGGDSDPAGKAEELKQNSQAQQMGNVRITPKQPEEFTLQMQSMAKQIYPIMEWHDELMHSIDEFIEKIPVLPDLLEQLTEQINIFVFSLLAPFVLPLIKQIKTELNTGSSEIIQSSNDKQHIVFNDDNSSDPTHSMLSKDHFSNVLNEPAGKIASAVLKWAVPQIMSCYDDERIDVDRTLNRIISAVFHHPHLRQYGDDGAADGRAAMFGVVEQWWREKDEREKDELRSQLSRDGVEQGRNHKPGVHDTGHGCGKPLGMAKTGNSSGGLGAALGGVSDILGGGNSGGSGGGNSDFGKMAGEAVGGGLLGGLVGAIGGDLLSGLGNDSEKKQHSSQGYQQDGGYNQTVTETAHRQQGYAQAKYSETAYPDGGSRQEYSQYQQQGSDGRGSGGYGYQERREEKPTNDGGYEQRTQRTYESGGGYRAEERVEGRTGGGESYEKYS
jgi:Heterokaryon incompatibility protein Het-C